MQKHSPGRELTTYLAYSGYGNSQGLNFGCLAQEVNHFTLPLQRIQCTAAKTWQFSVKKGHKSFEDSLQEQISEIY